MILGQSGGHVQKLRGKRAHTEVREQKIFVWLGDHTETPQSGAL